MGNKITKQVFKSQVVRPLQNYNVEDRAIKLVSRDKPVPAPPHPSMKKLMDEIKNDPELLKKGQVDPLLSEKLSHVYLTSQGDNPIIQRKAKLPEDRHHPEDFEFGYEEPKIIPEGRATLRQILQFLSKHQNDPEKYKAEDIAAEYKLDIANVNDILKHFKPFQVYTPTKRPVQSTLSKMVKA